MDELDTVKCRLQHLENQINLLTEVYLDLKSDLWVDSVECCEKLKISRSTLERYRKAYAKEGVHYKIHGERCYRYNWQKMQELLQGKG